MCVSVCVCVWLVKYAFNFTQLSSFFVYLLLFIFFFYISARQLVYSKYILFCSFPLFQRFFLLLFSSRFYSFAFSMFPPHSISFLCVKGNNIHRLGVQFFFVCFLFSFLLDWFSFLQVESSFFGFAFCFIYLFRLLSTTMQEFCVFCLFV